MGRDVAPRPAEVAGDAAHLMPPFAGQGMCAGLRDAMNLAGKLSLVLQGKANDAVLDSYGPERAPHVREFIDFSISLGQVICITDPEAAAARDAQMIAARLDPTVAPPSPAPSPRLGPGLLRVDDPAAGLMSIQAPVTSATGTGLFDDVVGAGVLLLRSDSLHLNDSRANALNDVGLTVIALGANPSADAVVDDTGAYTAWLDGFGAYAVLIRPDFAVYGTARGNNDLTSLVDEYLTHLGHTTNTSTRFRPQPQRVEQK